MFTMRRQSITHWQTNWRRLLIPIGASAVLYTARVLTPSATGTGTHEQLGLPACPLLHLTGVPCPTCGYTTSFAYAARGQFVQAFFTQPAGFVFFCLTVLSLPVSLYLFSRCESWTQLLGTKAARSACYILLGVITLGWIYKIVATK